MVSISNPYDDIESVEWDREASVSGDTAIAHKVQGHIHPNYDPLDSHVSVYDYMIGEQADDAGEYLPDEEQYTIVHVNSASDGGVTWPPSEYSDGGRDPEVDGVVAFPGLEWRPNEHVIGYFTTVDEDDVGEPDDRSDNIRQIVEGEEYFVLEDGALALLAHPEQYYSFASLDWERYEDDFEEFTHDDGFIGLEVYNRRQPEIGDDKDIRLWDRFLTAYGPDRLPIAVGVDDPNPSTDNDIEIGAGLDRYYTTIPLTDDEFDPSDQEGSMEAIANCYREGRLFSHRRSSWDHPEESVPDVPEVHGVDVDHDANTIELDTEHAETIEWISRGNVVEAGEQIDIDETHVPYVRARLESNPDGETITQAFGVDGPAAALGDADLGDVEIGG